ncbi:hypothetical protein DQ04_17681000 [Trypanosoma grayi]|uniref:hypothetical protein n=1 Tax=Trypanosoma grayi TaxID=71804 RepID=UPI0004F3F82C|nr:hypothetical protein DQ04_17681000 [Trypanosoma grayi]KEG05870.1 hypothetical protein DQ04_17681000 [Trypanosoma grayi]
MATPLYLTAGKDRNVVLRNAESVVSVLRRVFLVRCPGNDCPRVTTDSGEDVVHLDACASTSVSSRVYLSDLRVLSAQAGVYAVCVDDGDGEYTAPAALPVTVLEKPFAFKITADPDRNTVTIGVSGGDLEWRREPYTVCAVPLSDTCDSVSAGPRMCEKSELPNSLSVFLDLASRGMLVKDVKLCFIAANVTIGGRTYTQMFDLSEGKGGKKLSGGVIAGIVIAGIALVIALVVTVVYVLPRRRKNRRESLDTGTQPLSTVPHSVQRESNPLTTVSVDASPPTTVPPQDDGAVQVPVFEQSGNAVEQHRDPRALQEVVDGNSAPLTGTHENGAMIITGNNNSHGNSAQIASRVGTSGTVSSRRRLLRRTVNNVTELHAMLRNGVQGGVVPQRNAIEEFHDELSMGNPSVEHVLGPNTWIVLPPVLNAGFPEDDLCLPLTNQNLDFLRSAESRITHPSEMDEDSEESEERDPKRREALYKKFLAKEKKTRKSVEEWCDNVNQVGIVYYDPFGRDYYNCGPFTIRS